MSSIVMPNDRSTKQPARGFCRNPNCRDSDKKSDDFTFPIEHAHVACPKCGANTSPMVGIFVLIHMLIPVADGPLAGTGGIRYALACDDQRAYMATSTNLEAATNDIECANCPGCIANAAILGIEKGKLWTPDA